MSNVRKAPGIVGEGKAASCFLVGAGDFNVLEFESCARATIEKIGFYKDAPGDGGIGLKVSRSPWIRIMDVGAEGVFGAGGFERGVYLQNCLSSEIDLTVRDNVYGFYADYLLDGSKFVSRPNGLKLRGEYGRNKRWGIRVDEPGMLDFSGIVEGNGWGATGEFRGGMYMPNGGTEAGIGARVHDSYFEMNAGRADIYILQVINPGTVYNIEGNTFANLDMIHYVENHIWIESGVDVVIGLSANKFDSQGSYVHNASRRAVAAANPSLVEINMRGDKSQFLNPIEWPLGFGAMGLCWAGRVNSNGSPAAMPSGWKCSKNKTGTYLITPPQHLAISDFAWTAGAMGEDSMKVARTTSDGGNLFVLTTDMDNMPADAAFNWTAIAIK